MKVVQDIGFAYFTTCVAHPAELVTWCRIAVHCCSEASRSMASSVGRYMVSDTQIES